MPYLLRMPFTTSTGSRNRVMCPWSTADPRRPALDFVGLSFDLYIEGIDDIVIRMPPESGRSCLRCRDHR